MRFRFFHLFVGVVLGGTLGHIAAAADNTPGPPPLRQTLDRALSFMATDSTAWRKKFGCATCHHGAMTVWVMNEARQQGWPIDDAALAEFTRWTRDQFVPRINEPRDPRPGWNLVSTPGIYLGIMSQNLPVLSREELGQLSLHLANHVEEDGTFKKPPPKNGSPPTWESRETLTLLGLLAWENTVPADAQQASLIKEAREKADAWLAANAKPETVQAIALHLVLDLRRAAPKEQIQSRIDALLHLQNADGGWSQTPKIPSDAYATGQTLWALSFAGVDKQRPEITRAVAFLARTQKPDGSWPMEHRDHEGIKPKKHNLVPITYFGSAWGTLGLLRSVEVTPLLDLALRQQRAHDAIRALSGTCTVDEKRPGKPVTGIAFEFEIGDRELAAVIRHLSVFPDLESLTLETERLSDDSLGFLNGLPKLRKLTLLNAKITDTGLAKLKTLQHLENLNLKGTQVTDAGIADFHQALPNTKVEH
jgi:hypothetical protein